LVELFVLVYVILEFLLEMLGEVNDKWHVIVQKNLLI